MTLIPRDAFFGLDMNDFFEPLLTRQRDKQQVTNSFATPKVDIKEDETGFEITAEMPGVKKENVQVHVEEGVLTIEASNQSEDVEKDESTGKVIRRERHSGRYVRSFTIGKDIHEEDIKANLEHGILTLSLPKKKEPEATKRKISVG